MSIQLFTGIGKLALMCILLSACAAKESRQQIEPEKVASYGTAYTGQKSTLVVGNFENRSDYLRGLFTSNNDRLGNQSKTILKTHLQQSQRFKVVDRENMENIANEAQFKGVQQNVSGARYLITGAVTEFGRRETGDKQLFGILGAGKKQTAYAKVSLNIVDVLNSEIVHSVQGAGEYSLNEREVLGFGSNASYDATLNGKVLNFAITAAINTLVADIDAGNFRIEQ